MAIRFKKISDLRVDNDLLQKDVAKILGVNKNTYPHWETGLYEIPLEIVDKLARHYGVSVDYLTGLSMAKEKKQYRPLDLEVLCARLKRVRKSYKLSQEELADKVDGLTQINCSRYENGKVIIPFSKLFLIAKTLNVSLDYLLGRSDEMNIKKKNILIS